ncbi:MAG: M16 family metallopeptidase [Anaerotignaceae bacterium]
MFKTYEINQGIRLHYLKDSKFKTNTIAIFIRTKLSAENATKTALVAECIKGGCTKHVTRRDMAVVLEEMYGSVFDVSVIKRGDEQIIYTYFEGIRGYDVFEKGTEFLGDMLYNPIIKGNALKKAKKSLKESIEAVRDDKGEYAVERMTAEMCGTKDNFGVPTLGYSKDVDGIDEDNLNKYYHHLMTCAPMDIFIVGDGDDDMVRNRFTEIFSDVRCNIEEVQHSEYKSSEDKPKIFLEHEQVNQGKLCMCYSTGLKVEKNSLLSLMVLNEIIGGGASGRLFLEVREKEGLCYSIGSFVFKHKMLLVVQAGIDKKAYDKVVGLIENAIKDIKKEIDEKSVEDGKKNIIKAYEGVGDTPVDRINFAFSMILLGLEFEPTEFIEEIKKVTSGQVADSAKVLKSEIIYFLR